MSIVEFIGFIVSLVAILLIMLRRNWEDRQRKNHPERYNDEADQEDALKNFLRALEGDMEEGKEISKKYSESPLPPLPILHKEEEEIPLERTHRTVADDFQFQAKLDRFQRQSAIDSRHIKLDITSNRFEKFQGNQVVSQDMKGFSRETTYDIIDKVTTNRAREILTKPKTLQDMIVIQEILGPPKGLQKNNW